MDHRRQTRQDDNRMRWENITDNRKHRKRRPNTLQVSKNNRNEVQSNGYKDRANDSERGASGNTSNETGSV